MITPPNNKPGIYLCRVSGLKHCDYMVLSYSGEFWWRYTLIYDNAHNNRITEGWCGLDTGINILEIIKLLKEEE